MWDETTTKQGSNEVASCLYNYIAQVDEKEIFYGLIIVADKVVTALFSMYLYAAQKLNVCFCHRFLKKVDSVYAFIKRSSKNKMI